MCVGGGGVVGRRGRGRLQILEITPWLFYCFGNNFYLEIFRGVHLKFNHIWSDLIYFNLLITEFPCAPMHFPAPLQVGGSVWLVMTNELSVEVACVTSGTKPGGKSTCSFLILCSCHHHSKGQMSRWCNQKVERAWMSGMPGRELPGRATVPAANFTWVTNKLQWVKPISAA